MTLAHYLLFNGAVYRVAEDQNLGNLVDAGQFNAQVQQMNQALQLAQKSQESAKQQYEAVVKFFLGALGMLDAYKSNPGQLATDQKNLKDGYRVPAGYAFNPQGMAETAKVVDKLLNKIPKYLRRLHEQAGTDLEAAKATKQKLLQSLGNLSPLVEALNTRAQHAASMNQTLTNMINKLNSYKGRQEKDRQKIYQAYLKQFGGQKAIEHVTNLSDGLGRLSRQIPQLFELYKGALAKIDAEQKRKQPAAPAAPAARPGFDPSKRLPLGYQPEQPLTKTIPDKQTSAG